MDEVLFGKPEGGDEGEGDKHGGHYKTILQGKMFGERGGIFFGEVVGIDELMKDAESGDPDGAAQLLQVERNDLTRVWRSKAHPLLSLPNIGKSRHK